MMVNHVWSIAWLILPMVAATANSDSCDWIGSGSPRMALSRGVQPVYLRCAQGTLLWHYPRGALRVVLRHGLPESTFRACFKMSPGSSGARVYLASKKKLHPVFSSTSPVDVVRCVKSREGHLALYVEADPLKEPLQKHVAGFSYYLMKLPKSDGGDDDCRPCSEEELLQQFCTSDFVMRGTVSSLYHNSQLQRSEITVHASKVYQDSNPPLFAQDNSLQGARLQRHATVYRSLQCGTKPGSGEYLFFGRWILGSPTLTCIPRLSEWKKVRRKALQSGASPCLLDL